MTLREEGHISFHNKLRQLAYQQDTASQPADLQRNRAALQKLLENRCHDVVATILNNRAPAVSHKIASSSNGSTPKASASARCTASGGQSIGRTCSNSRGDERRTPNSAVCHPEWADIQVEFDTALARSVECLSAAYFLFSCGLHEDVMNVCLRTMEGDVVTVLSERCKAVGASWPGGAGTKQAPQADFLRQDDAESNIAAKSTAQLVLASDGRQGRLKFATARCIVMQYKFLLEACAFFQLLSGRSGDEGFHATISKARAHMDAVVQILIAACNNGADDNYFGLYNGTVVVYEMCLHLLRYARNGTGEVVPFIVRSIAYCIEICETGTLKLCTVRYLPWRLRLHEFICNCYEQLGVYDGALMQAQRALAKVRELVELEFIGKVGPPEESENIMLTALRIAHLNVLKYTWYWRGSSGERPSSSQSPSGGDGLYGIKPGTVSGESTARDSSESDPIELPLSGFDLLDKAWQTLLRVELPTKAEACAAVIGGAGYRLSKTRQQQRLKERRNMDDTAKNKVVQQVRGTLLRFLLSMATQSDSKVACLTGRWENGDVDAVESFPFMAKMRLWAVSAIEFLAHHAVRNYIQQEPTVLSWGLEEEFVGADEEYQIKNDLNAEAFASRLAKKRSGKRKGREGNVFTQKCSLVDDETLLKSITLDAILQEMGYPRAPSSCLSGEDATQYVTRVPLYTSKAGEEGLVAALLFHCTLYDGFDASLYGRLCVCSIHATQKKYEEQLKDETSGISPRPAWKAAGRKAKTAGIFCGDLFTTSLHILRHMRRQRDSVDTVRGNKRRPLEDIYGMIPMAQELRRLLGQCKRAAVVSVTKCEGHSKATTVVFGVKGTGTPSPTPPSAAGDPGAQPQLLGSNIPLSETLWTLCQKLLERGADTLRQQMSFFSLGDISKRIGSLGPVRCGVDRTNAPQDCVTERDPIEAYHMIVSTYLDLKANSGLTNAVEFGDLVLQYAKDISTEVAIAKYKNSGNRENNDDNGDVFATSATAGTSSLDVKSDLVSGISRGMEYEQSLRKKHRHAMLGVAAINVALRWLSRCATRADLQPSLQSAGVMRGSSPGAAVVDDGILHGEREIRDMQTDLMRWRIDLGWVASLLSRAYTAHEKHRENVKEFMNRHAKGKIYGVITLKEKNVLKSLVKDEPKFSYDNELERKRMIAWARETSDTLLLALVLLCLAAHQQQQRVQREMLEQAFHLLEQPEWYQPDTVMGAGPLSQRGGSAYSLFMIWCYAVTICGKLGFTEWMERSRNALYGAFVSGRKERGTSSCTTAALSDEMVSRGVTANPVETPCSFASASTRAGGAVLFRPSEEALAMASPLQLRALVSAILWMSVADMKRHVYKNFQLTGLLPFTTQNSLVDMPFRDRYKLSETQGVYIQCACRIQFVMELAFRVDDREGILSCAFQLFNALLPLLVDENYCAAVLPPLGTLCKMLLLYPGSVTDDACVQLLAARVLGALANTIRRMSASSPHTVSPSDGSCREPAVLTQPVAPASGGSLCAHDDSPDQSFILPSTVSGWYELLLRVFGTVWNRVYSNPNARQVRHKQRIRMNAERVQRIITCELGSVEGQSTPPTAGTRVENSTHAASGRPRTRSRGNSESPLCRALGSAVNAPVLPGSLYLAPDDIIDDCMPIEYVELLGEVLFKLPSVSPGSVQKVNSCGEKTSETPVSGQTGCIVLLGVPEWVLRLAHAADAKCVMSVIEHLHEMAEHPLYARTVLHIVENLMNNGDMLSARSLAEEALKHLASIHNAVNEHQCQLLESVRAWLTREGWSLAPLKGVTTGNAEGTPLNQQRDFPVGKESLPAAGRSLRSPSDGSAPPSGGGRMDRNWSSAEKQMLRQLTCGFAWLRRRRAMQYLRSRLVQFCAPFVARLYSCLGRISIFKLEQSQQFLRRGNTEGPKSSRCGNKASGGTEGGLCGSEETPRSGRRAAQSTALGSDTVDEGKFLQYASRSARIFNRCGLPSQAFEAICLVVDGIRTFVCDDPSDVRPPTEAHDPREALCNGLPPFGGDAHSGEATGVLSDPRMNHLIDCLLVTGRRASSRRTAPPSYERLVALGPLICSVAQTLSRVLFLLWNGYVDYRHDINFVQPNVVKVGRDVLLQEQLGFHGRVPSLFSYVSAAGQYEEGRLEHATAMEQRRRAQLFTLHVQEILAEEQLIRVRLEFQYYLQLEQSLEVSLGWSPVSAECLTELGVGREAMLGKEDERKGAYEAVRNQREQWEENMLKKRRKIAGEMATRVHISGPIVLDDPDDVILAAKRFGYTVPMEKAVSHLVFLLKCVQHSCQLPSLEIVDEVQKFSGGAFSSSLLPFAVSVRRAIGESIGRDLTDRLSELCRNEPRHKVLSRNARWMWQQYTKTDAFTRAMQRLGRSLMPSWEVQASVKINPLAFDNATFNAFEEHSLVSDAAGDFSRPPGSARADASAAGDRGPFIGSEAAAGAKAVTLHSVVMTYESLTSYLRQRRLFGMLADELYELGHIYILHRQRAEAERCWLDSADAALEVPESLRNLTSTEVWAKFSASAIGFPRILVAVLSLTSLAMYAYRDQQKRAVDAYLLSVRILERLFDQASSGGSPQCLRDYGGFLLEDIVILPHLCDPLTSLMPRIVHHLLFLGGELLQFKFPLYSAMVASLAEYLARTYMRHTQLTVEIRLLQAKAAAYSGNYRASMRLLRDVCLGRRVPSVSFGSLDLCLHGGGASKTVKNAKGSDAGWPQRRQMDTDVGSSQAQQLQQQQQQRDQLWDAGLFNESELPTSPGNVACIHVFISQCFPSLTPDGFALGDAGVAFLPNSLFMLLSAGSGLPEAVVAHYGARLSRRVELAVAECLVVLGSSDTVYVWGTLGAPSSPPATAAAVGERRSSRSRASQKQVNQTIGSSACHEALLLAEQVLQGVLARQQKQRQQPGRAVGNSSSDGDQAVPRNRKALSQNAAAAQVEDVQAKRWRVVEESYTRCTSERLLAKIYTARGESSKAVKLLKELLEFCAVGSRLVCNIPSVPSYLWTVGTHTFWCDIYEILILNYIRLLEHNLALQVVNHALFLCDQCGDSYRGRVFSLYRAAIGMRAGTRDEAEETIASLVRVSEQLGCDSRVELLHPWTVLAHEILRYGGRQERGQKAHPSSIAVLEKAVQGLHDYTTAHNFLPSYLLLHGKNEEGAKDPSGRGGKCSVPCSSPTFLPWSTNLVFLHRAVNVLAEEYTRKGLLDQAESLLQRVISHVAPRYDTTFYPTQLIDSHFILAHVLCQRDPSLLTPRQRDHIQSLRKSRSVVDGGLPPLAMQELLSDNGAIAALEPHRQRPVRLLMFVIQQMVSSGVHEYNALRCALLLLSALLSQAGKSSCIMASNCAVLAKLVADMGFHAFSGTSVFSVYEDPVALGAEVMFTENVTAHIYYQQRNLGNVVEKGVAWRDGLGNPPTTQRGTSSQPRSRDERERLSQRNNVPLSAVVSAFAALHRERSVSCVFPPQEYLNIETGLRHVRAFLQTRTASLSCGYLWHTEGADPNMKQQVPSVARAPIGLRTPRALPGVGGTAAEEAALTANFQPPIVIDTLPSLVSASTLQQLNVPRANTVIFHSLTYDVGCTVTPISIGIGYCSGDSSSYRRGDSTTVLKFVLFVSPLNDSSATHPPLYGDKAYNVAKKGLRMAGRAAVPQGGASCNDASRSGDAYILQKQWSDSQCVAFECPLADVQRLHAHATHTLYLMQNPATCSLVTNQAAVAEAGADDGEVSIAAALTQQLTETLLVLQTKTGPPNSGKKQARAAVGFEGLLSGVGNLSAAFPSNGNNANATAAGGVSAEKEVPPGGASANCDVTPLDEAKSKLVTDFIQMVVASIVPRTTVDEALMETHVRSLLPRCAVTADMVRFMMSAFANDGSGASLFNPGLHEWFSRIAKFVSESAS
uniref:WGS project CAEQ00000000 data, annotated contig 1446 n=1 Tax=Trypanosoma congolense (strain IL3000) TaxID=1068625 RepID=F9W6B8_TRYCI|nr:unnamed protein product [Trypanosoma congolense IL3000]